MPELAVHMGLESDVVARAVFANARGFFGL